MEPLPVDVIQLQRRDPAAWTALLSRSPELADVAVTAVTSEPLWNRFLTSPGRTASSWSRHVRRYVLTLADHSDPISFIAKRTSPTEACVYQSAGERLAGLAPRARYVHLAGDRSWVILDDVPDHFPPDAWTPEQTDAVVESLARLHAASWDADGSAAPCGVEHFTRLDSGAYTWQELRQRNAVFFEDGPGAVITDHAIHNTGRLAPLWLQAANGLVVMRDLGGWPGVLGESQLAAAADLLDDPVPLLSALADLPPSLIHGQPHPYHWRLTLFDEQYLIDWSEAALGPGVLDLMAFIEHYPLLYMEVDEGPADRETGYAAEEPLLCLREMTPLMEETLVDGYILTMSAELGAKFPARDFRQALPAARCLHVLTTWFPYFASWFTEMPNKYLWQRMNRMSESELAEYNLGPMAGVRPYLAGVFDRFLHAYRSL